MFSLLKESRLSKTFGLVLVLTMVLAFAACGQPEESEEQPQPDEPESEIITVTDDRGAEIELEAPPATIVTIGPSNTEILYGIGAGNLVIGADSFSDWPERVRDDAEDVGTLREPNIEKITELQPDLVIASTIGIEVIEKLEDLGLTVAGFEASSLDHMYEVVGKLGVLTDSEEGAQRLTAAMQESMECIQDEIGEVEERPGVFFEVGYEPIFTAGAGTFPDELMEMAEAENVFSDLDDAWAEVNPEAVIERDPDVIIATMEQTKNLIEEGQRPGWENITAVRDDRIEKLNPDLLHRPGPRLVFGMGELAAVIWGERVDELTCLQDYEDELTEWINE